MNEPGWISISFGFDKSHPGGHGTWSADFFATRIDKVVDPKHPGTLDRPAEGSRDMVEEAAWTHAHGSADVGQDRRPRWTRLDIVGGDKGATIGPIPGLTQIRRAFGFGPRQSARIVVVNVDGHDVLITIGADSPAHFKRAVEAIQPLVDSIVWQ